MAHDFTLAKYAELCEALLDSGYETATVAEYLAQGQRFVRVAVLRHDVDRWPENAVHMAELEHGKGVRGTYYSRATPQVLHARAIRKIVSLGHEIGYHYETLATSNGNYDRAIQLFEKNLAAMRTLYPVQTIAMHGSPLSRYDNRDLWKRCDYHHYGLLGEVYLDVDYARAGYATDTGRSWSAARRNVRDRPLSSDARAFPKLAGTNDLIALVRSRHLPHLLLQIHPERWAWSTWTYVRSYITDVAVNSVKLTLAHSSWSMVGAKNV